MLLPHGCVWPIPLLVSLQSEYGVLRAVGDRAFRAAGLRDWVQGFALPGFFGEPDPPPPPPPAKSEASLTFKLLVRSRGNSGDRCPICFKIYRVI